MPTKGKYLNASDYEDLSFRVELRIFLLNNRGLVLISILFVLVIAFNLATGDTLSDVVTWSLIILFLFTQSIVPHSIVERVKRSTAHGIPTPSSVANLRSQFRRAVGPLTAASALGFAILGYAWIAPQGGLTFLRPTFAIITNVCVVLTFWSYSWGGMLGKIQQERYDSLHGGWEILLPMGVASAGTAVISIISGVAHWEDSIAFYGPAILLSLQVARSIPEQSRLSPKFVRMDLTRLGITRSKLQSKLAWILEQKDEYDQKKFQIQTENLQREITSVEKKQKRYEDALSKYESLVDKVVKQALSYELRRAARETIVNRPRVGGILGPEIEKVMDQSIQLISVSPENEPRSYVERAEFDEKRQIVTVMNFNLILQALGEFPPLVTKVELKPLSNEFDRSTYESYGPTALKCAIMRYERGEEAWMWENTKSLEAAIHAFGFLHDYQKILERFRDETEKRINLFDKIVKLDPDSEYVKIAKTVRNGKSSLTSKLKELEAAAAAAEEACSLLEPYKSTLQSSS